MPLKAKVQNLNEVAEEHQGLYRALPNNGGFVVDVLETDGFALEDIGGLRGALQTQKGDLQSLRDQLKLFDGIDASTIANDLSELARLRQLDPKAMASEQVQEAVRQTEQKYEGIVQGLKTERDERDGVISGLLIDTQANQALAEAGGATKLLLPHIKGNCKVVHTEDGQAIVQVLDHNGNPRIAVEDGKTRDFTITDLVAEMKNDDVYAVGFAADGKPGVGGPTDHKGHQQKGNRVLTDSGHETVSGNLEDIASGKAVVQMD